MSRVEEQHPHNVIIAISSLGAEYPPDTRDHTHWPHWADCHQQEQALCYGCPNVNIGSAIKQAPAPHSSDVLQDIVVWKRCSSFVNITDKWYGKVRGSWSHELLLTGHHPIPGQTPDRWLLWKLPNAEETRRGSSNPIESKSDKMSAKPSPMAPMALLPFAHEPAAVLQAQSFLACIMGRLTPQD